MERRKKILVNSLEKSGSRQLEDWSRGNGYSIHPKVGLSQSLDIKNSGLSDPEYRYALQASFDFVVASSDGGRILFAVEVDGESHKGQDARERDQLKNSICEKLGMPLIRVGPRAIETRLAGFSSVLTWLATLCPYAEALEDAYKNGIIPEDEIVSPLDVIDFEDGKLGFPFDPFRKSIDKIWTFINNKHLRNFPFTIRTCYSEYAAGGVVSFCLAYVREGVLLGIGGCLSGSRLPVPEYEVSDGLALLDIESQLAQYANGKLKPLLAPQVVARLRKYDWPKEWHFEEADGVHPVIEFSTRRARK